MNPVCQANRVQVAIKTMKKTFDSFTPCLELREVIFLRTLPNHAHLVPALDIFLDPFSKKLHIAMEYMDGNLYQLMKARDHKCMDPRSVKSILYQILSGLDHIHAHQFFHRDIKPENILVSTSAPHDSHSTFSRYSALVTPPSTPPTYSIKIADFGLARETHSKLAYTTYVSTRWYRAPEVLLRAGQYSAPVDIWAIGAMAVEIATLKPLFPGGNEVDQVWRVCEIMGSPGNWYTKSGVRVGGGEWREGTRLAQKLGFSFPKMAPHAIETILQQPQWPIGLSNFVTWCLMWDPKNRPTSRQAMDHEFFADAVDPLRPKSSSRLLGRKHSDLSFRGREGAESPHPTPKGPSWFRRSLVARDSAPAVPQHFEPKQVQPTPESIVSKHRPQAAKRATWNPTSNVAAAAPMPILPSIRPISPIANGVNAQAENTAPAQMEQKPEVQQAQYQTSEDKHKKVGRQLSVNSHSNHYADVARQEAERALVGSGVSGLQSPPYQKESFFSHLRKRARRFSGRHGLASPGGDDIEANAANVPWSNRSSMIVDNIIPEGPNDFSDLDQMLQSVRYSLDRPDEPRHRSSEPGSNQSTLKRTHSVPRSQQSQSSDNATQTITAPTARPQRRTIQMNQFQTPEEEDELLDEALRSANRAARRLDQYPGQNQNRSVLAHKDLNRQPLSQAPGNQLPSGAYLTPSPSAKRNSVPFDPHNMTPAQPLNILKRPEYEHAPSHWPTPPYDDNEWASAAAASVYATGAAGTTYR